MPSLQQGFDDRPWGLVGARMRLARPILKPGRAVHLVALDPLVRGLAADAESHAQLGDREEVPLVIGDEA